MGFLFGALALFIVIGIAMVNQESTMDEVEKRIEEERKKEPKPEVPSRHVDSNPAIKSEEKSSDHSIKDIIVLLLLAFVIFALAGGGVEYGAKAVANLVAVVFFALASAGGGALIFYCFDKDWAPAGGILGFFIIFPIVISIFERLTK